MRFHLKLFLLAGFLSMGIAQANNQAASNPENDNVFWLEQPDYALSPKTGMTRKHWKDAALYLLKGTFGYVKTIDDPMKFPKQPGKSYPQNDNQIPTEKLEGLCRTLFVAAPLLKEDPNLEINGIRVGEYYRHQIQNLIDPNSPAYIKPRSKNGGPSQILVEFGGLSVALFAIPNILWEPLSKEQKDALASTMLSYGDGPTVDSNWKFFNIFVMSFFKSQGYTVNDKLLEEYLQKSLKAYRGEGWYNDSPAFDYYSMWAFQMYGTLWSEFFGKKNYPEYAKQFQQNFYDLKDNYPYLFSRDGKMIMWGRSICYRTGAIVPFPLMGFYNQPDVNYGWMRRIASGVLLQFFQNPGFLKDGVPTLGFYGAFEPAVQIYSCRGSAYWLAKAFLGLLAPADSPFWTAKENEGPWENELQIGQVYNKFEKGSNILITDYPNIGASEVRAWCHEKVKDDWQKFRSTENYNRLSYNSAFPWQADGENGEVAMNYVIKNKQNKWEALRLYDFRKFENGVYYRDVILETNPNVKLQLADIPLANGILRVDRNISTDTVDMRLGHYALPELNTPIREESRKVNGHQVRIINNGEYQLAMIPLKGWEKIQNVRVSGLHPVSDKSAVIDVCGRFIPGDKGKGVYITLMLWKRANELWTNDELDPVKKIIGSGDGQTIEVLLKTGETKTVVF
ncbi:DUF2264 domain-containing protein [Parabacteroides sp. FAFU027]|uniref:DUF2264 domain-containing protein n=1 Tax=Parabacteroides sp. FAFU027 TaxID=2922715 RepID=UPI001FB01FBC|nr:DUF2264 domain-containing protein [Parabacteroides sp. FAFU027]